MSAILNSLNAYNFPILQPILMTLLSKPMVYRALSYKTYLLLGLWSPFIYIGQAQSPQRALSNSNTIKFKFDESK